MFRKNPRDSVLVDRDFDSVGLKKVQFYLEVLLSEYFALPRQQLVTIGDDQDRPVFTADALSRQARRGRVRISLRNPSITKEFNLLLNRL